MNGWNDAVFLVLNAPASPGSGAVFIAFFAAKGFVYIGAALAVGLWVWGSPEKRGALIASAAGMVTAFAISSSITLVWYVPRPFEVGLGHTLMSHAPETSFPSDHATFLWTLAFCLIASRAWRAWGWLLAFMGLGTAWARIYLGVHFPLDMLGSFAVAVTSAGVAMTLRPILERRVLPIAQRLYNKSLAVLRLPARIVPRSAPVSRGNAGGQRER